MARQLLPLTWFAISDSAELVNETIDQARREVGAALRLKD